MDLIAAFFWVKDSPMGRLSRTEGLVFIVAIILFLVFVLDFYRSRSRNSALRYSLLVLEAVSESIVTYTIGLAENADFGIQQLQLQVLLLQILENSVGNSGGISAYSVDQAELRRSLEAASLMQFVWLGYLIFKSGTAFLVPLCMLWVLNFIEVLQRVVNFEQAYRLYKGGRRSIYVASYMKYLHEQSQPDQDQDVAALEDAPALESGQDAPALESGCKYLVLGEEQQEWKDQTPHQLMKLMITREEKLITVGKIFQCQGRLLSGRGGDGDGKLKDRCLSFAMHKLLLLRFDNWHRSPEYYDHSRPHNWFKQWLTSGGFRRPFRVAEDELAFLSDLFYTRYPIIFSGGFSIYPILKSSLAVMACCCIAVQLFTVESKEGQLRYMEYGLDVGKAFTILLLVVVTLKELWEIITYILSDWAKVLLLCKYVEKPSWQRSKCIEKILGCLCRLRFSKPWQRKIGQYSFLGSFDYKPWTNLGSMLTRGLINATAQGAKKCNPIIVPVAVKKAVHDSLKSSDGQLTNGRLSIERNNMVDQEGNEVDVSWALAQHRMTQSILIWHIATSLCEIAWLREHRPNDGNLTCLEKCLKIPRSCAAYIKNWWKPLPFYVNLENLPANLHYHYEVAASLSRYCAYLVVFQWDLVSDPSHVVVTMLGEAIRDAREYFEGLGSMESRYEKMMATADPSETIIANGVKLGKQLIGIASDEVRWKVLAEFWAEWILYMALSDDTSAHELALGCGGEFMTVLWALLTHAGIQKQPEAPDSIV